MGLSLDLCFGGGGSIFFKLGFVGGGVGVYFEFLGDFFFEGIFFLFFVVEDF